MRLWKSLLLAGVMSLLFTGHAAALSSAADQCAAGTADLAVIVTNYVYPDASGWNENDTSKAIIERTVFNNGVKMAELFKSAGFCVLLYKNLTLAELKEVLGDSKTGTSGTLAALHEKRIGNRLTVVYYAGHAEASGRTQRGMLLAPVDGHAGRSETTYDVDDLIITLRGETLSSRTSIVLLDGCRRMGLPASFPMAQAPRSSQVATLGPAPDVFPGRNVRAKVIELYATQELYPAKAGAISDDHTWWTGALLKALKIKGMNFLQAVKMAEIEVSGRIDPQNRQDGTQLPVIYGSVSLLERFSLFPLAEEDQAWVEAQKANTVDAFRDFIFRFPFSRHVNKAAEAGGALPKGRPAPPAETPDEAQLSQAALDNITELPVKNIELALQAVVGKPNLVDDTLDKEAVNAFLKQRGLRSDSGTLSPEQTLTLIAAAAAKGDIWGLSTLGYMHVYGIGVPRNLIMAEVWFREAGRGDDAIAKFNLAKFLLQEKPSITAAERREACTLLKEARRKYVPAQALWREEKCSL